METRSTKPLWWLRPTQINTHTFCLCIMLSRSPNGDSSGLSKASSASVRSISVRHSLLSSPCSASCDCANSSAASVSRKRMSSIRCCCYKSFTVKVELGFFFSVLFCLLIWNKRPSWIHLFVHCKKRNVHGFCHGLLWLCSSTTLC